MLSPEQADRIKSQILKQVENFPLDKRESARQQIESMNEEELESFLEKNKLIKKQKSQECIFCSILSGDIQSYKIDESKNAVAILEINPISKGHILIIPKKHFALEDKIPINLSLLIEKIIKKIKVRLKPKEIKIFPANLFGHGIINVLPIYKDENINSKRNSAKPEELKKLQEIFEKEEKIIKQPKAKKMKENIWLPKRIP